MVEIEKTPVLACACGVGLPSAEIIASASLLSLRVEQGFCYPLGMPLDF
jgi:hypothetical protein